MKHKSHHKFWIRVHKYILLPAVSTILILLLIISPWLIPVEAEEELTLFQTTNSLYDHNPEFSAEVADYILEQLSYSAESIDVRPYNLSNTEVFSQYFELVRQHPELFWVKAKLKISYNQNGKVKTIIPSYYTPKTNRYDFELTLNLIYANLGDNPTIEAINDYLVSYMHYSGIDTNVGDALLTQSGNCEDYSGLFLIIVSHYNYNVRTVVSKELNHSWNIVELNGEWYHVDTTYNDPRMRNGGDNTQFWHEYLLLTEEELIELRGYAN